MLGFIIATLAMESGIFLGGWHLPMGSSGFSPTLETEQKKAQRFLVGLCRPLAVSVTG